MSNLERAADAAGEMSQYLVYWGYDMDDNDIINLASQASDAICAAVGELPEPGHPDPEAAALAALRGLRAELDEFLSEYD